MWARAALLVAFVVFGGVAAQPFSPLPPEAGAELEAARTSSERARVEYRGVVNHIDQPLWRDAMRGGERALELAPGHPEPLRFLGETYSFLRWNIRAWDHWLRYVDAGGALDEDAAALLAQAGGELGYARYQAGDLEGAAAFYERVHELVPDHRETVVWLGRIAFERGDTEASLPFWQALVERDPDDATARYYRDRARQRLEFGTAASDAFHEGLFLYDDGRTDDARQAFERAATANPRFVDAHAWAGRSALELGLAERARGHWSRVLELEPGDTRAPYFIGVADDQLAWGVEAAGAFHDGLAHYGRGDAAGALELFREAVRLNPDYTEALAWVSRIYGELGRSEEAVAYFEGFVASRPESTRARHFLQLARNQGRFGAEAATALADGLTAYGLADFASAEAAFTEAARLNPGYADAWGWLGRLAFDLGRYEEAEGYYARALELDPGVDAYRFFMEEAGRLARPEPEPDEPVAVSERAGADDEE